MKHFYSLIIVTAIVTLITAGKFACAQQEDNYYQICQSWDAYFAAHPDTTGDEDGDFIQYLRWKEFWRNRVDHTDTALAGSLTNLRKAYNDYYQSFPNQPADVNPSSWFYCGPKNQLYQNNALISAIWVDTISDKNYKIIYAGTDASGIWKTTDGGLNWTNITDASGLYCIGITNIKGDPTNSNIIYATTGGGGIDFASPWGIGLIQSTDAGATWTPIYSLTPPEKTPSQYVLVDPTDHNRLYAGIGGKVVRMEYNEITSTWTTMIIYDNTDPITRFIRDIEMKPGSPDVLYISTDDKSIFNRHRAQVFKITGANTNNPSTLFLHPFYDSLFSERYEIEVSSLTPNSVYVIGKTIPNNTADTGVVEIWKSVNSGLSWNLVFYEEQPIYLEGIGGGDLGYSKNEMHLSPTDTNVMYIGGNTMSKLINTSGVWNIVNTTIYGFGGGNGYHPDTRDAIVLKGCLVGTNGINDTIICGNDGGVSMSTNGITSWQNLNGTGLWANEFWGIGSAEKNPYWIGGGSTHTGFFVNYNNVWTRTLGGDAAATLVDFNEPNFVYVNTNSGTYRSLNFGIGNFMKFLPTLYEPSVYNPPLVLNPKNTNIMYSGARNLFKNNHVHTNLDDFNVIQVQLSGGASIDNSEKINCIAVSETNSDTILFSYESPYFSWQDTSFHHKLILTTDGGVTFNDLLSYQTNHDLFQCLSWAGIRSIVISPTESNKMWVALSGFSGNPGINKVYYSSDGGTSFSDISAGLPDFPVNCLKYWKSGNDRLFMGTEVGVFYKEGTNDWQPFNAGLPITMVTDIEVLSNEEILRVSTYGRGVWQTFLYPCTDVNSNDRIVSSDETWDTPFVTDRSILVKAPATLTIKTIVHFPEMTKIKVEPGATLICDTGCVLTNSCQGMWLGIEVWGNSSLDQTPANQGVVYFQHGAILKNARIGITTCKKNSNGEIVWNTTGGKIHAINCTFRNNFKAVEFLTYPYMQHSLFRNVLFETTGIFSDYGSTPQTFVSLFGIRNLRFEACTFINSGKNPYFIPSPPNGIGITSIDAIYSVLGTCKGSVVPCSEWTPSTIKGLYYGIKAENSNPTNSILIDKSKFEDNHRGVYLSGVNLAQVTSTEFNYPILYSPLPADDTIYGLYLNSCTGYKIQENLFHCNFTHNLSYLKRFIGIDVNNSGPDPNEIYNNTFDTLGIGILAQRFNRSRDGSTGLCLKCNDFDSTRYDQAVRYPDAPLFSTPWGISGNQGSNIQNDTAPAGNRFSANHRPSTSNGLSDIVNDGDRINYFYHQSWPPNLRIRPLYISSNVTTAWVLGTNYTKQTACPSKLNNGDPNHDQLKSDMVNEQAQVLSVKNQLAALVDGGNTEAITTDIYYSVPSEAIEIHDDLLSKSPYLSDTVMKSAIIKENVLPNAMIRDILVANPQSAKSDSVLGELDNRFDPMPETMMDEILGGKEIIGSKESLESQLAEHQLKESYFFNELVRLYKQDTSETGLQDSLLSLLQGRNTLPAKYMLAFEYLNRGENGNVTEVLNNIPSQFELSEAEQQQYQDYMNYFDVLLDLKSQNLTIFDINANQQSQLMQLANQGSEPVQTYARNVLLANHLISYSEPVYLLDETKSTHAGKESNTVKYPKHGSLKLFPNPAQQYVIIEYNFADQVIGLESVILTIISSDGKIVEQRKITKMEDQFLIDCRKLNSGSYICKMSSGKKTLGLGKFVIAK